LNAAQDMVLKVALALAEKRGIPVFPCRFTDKKPITKHGFYDASLDPEQIRQWWLGYPGALVGVPTGRKTNLLVLDVDPKGFKWYGENSAEMPCGRIHRTPRLGYHLVYHMSDFEVSVSASKFAQGVDVRANGGYVIWWPAHQRETVGRFDDIGPPPAFVLARLAELESKKKGKTNGKANGVLHGKANGHAGAADAGQIVSPQTDQLTVTEGGRNDFLFREGCSMRGRGYGEPAIEAALQALNVSQCVPSLEQKEVATIAASAARYDAGSNASRIGEASEDAIVERMDAEIATLDRMREEFADAQVMDATQTAYRERRSPMDGLLDTWMRHGEGAFSAEQNLAIQATLSTTTGSQGGFTVPTLVANRLADLLKDFSGVRRVAEVLRTTTGGPFGYPISDGTAEVGERLPENVAASDDDPNFATASLQTWKYSSKVFTVPLELLQDSMFDIEAFVLRRSAARIGRLSNTDFTVGTGVGMPTGFTGAAGAGTIGLTGQAASVIHDDLIDLVHSVNTAYRQIPLGLAFMMADVTFKFLRKLRDGANNRPLYLPSDGVQPETLLGYPVIVNDDVSPMAANAKSIFFGNWNLAYKIRDALDVTLYRFADSAYVNKGQMGFLCIARIGGNLVDANGVKYYQNSAA
jgi:HK97 family phage major capsid protein